MGSEKLPNAPSVTSDPGRAAPKLDVRLTKKLHKSNGSWKMVGGKK